MEKKKLILLLLSCAVITEAHAAYQGHVYVDSNRNGIYDKGEKVLKGIRVSDGLNVVKTNAEGVYTLPGHKRERFIFITTPSGYRTDNQYYRLDASFPGLQAEIVCLPCAVDPPVILIVCPIAGKDASSRMAVTGSSIFPIPRYSIRKTKKTGRITSGIMRLTRISHLSSIPVISAMKMD